MSSCDCDRKDSNGGSCDCKESPGFGFENTSTVSFAPTMAATKAARTVESASFESSAADPSCL